MSDLLIRSLKFAAGAAGAFFLGLHWMIHLLLYAILFDVATGMVAAFQSGTLNSTVSRAGVARKIQMLLMVAACEVVSRYLHMDIATPWGGVWGLGAGAAGYYCVHEALSITENLGRSGVPLPGFITARLEKLKEETEVESGKIL
jgi:toxin secretion/phage lysis holin